MEQTREPSRNSRLTIDLPCTKKSLGRAREKIKKFALENGFEPNIEDITLATQEAVKNVIQHACPADNNIHIEFVARPDRMIIEVTDLGQGFDVPLIENGFLSPLADHGRGIPLIKGLMDEVSITSDNEGTVVIMEKMRNTTEMH
jgi:anti-sigma regulatory factor (Ser/Thr protein kinase)